MRLEVPFCCLLWFVCQRVRVANIIAVTGTGCPPDPLNVLPDTDILRTAGDIRNEDALDGRVEPVGDSCCREQTLDFSLLVEVDDPLLDVAGRSAWWNATPAFIIAPRSSSVSVTSPLTF